MRKLDFMVGRWVGSGWNLNQSGQREEFTQTEKVHKAVSGLVLSVEGQGRAKSDPSTVVDSALAVINYNDTTSQYRWEAFSQGFVTEVVPVVGNNTFQ